MLKTIYIQSVKHSVSQWPGFFGNEGQGVSSDLLAQAQQVRIPQNSEIESLNVATAAAVCLYETLRVRSS